MKMKKCYAKQMVGSKKKMTYPRRTPKMTKTSSKVKK